MFNNIFLLLARTSIALRFSCTDCPKTLNTLFNTLFLFHFSHYYSTIQCIIICVLFISYYYASFVHHKRTGKFVSFIRGVFYNFSISLLYNGKEKYTKLVLATKNKYDLIVSKCNHVDPQTLIYF